MVGEKKWLPYVLLIPWVIGFLLFKLYPFVNSFIMSLFQERGRTVTFIGFEHYRTLFDTGFREGREFLNSLKVTFIYVFITVPLILVVSLLIAQLLARNQGRGFFQNRLFTSRHSSGRMSQSFSLALHFRNRRFDQSFSCPLRD